MFHSPSTSWTTHRNFTAQASDLNPTTMNNSKTSLVVQWLRICLPTQGTQVPSLVREDPTCLGAAKPLCHNY